MSATARLALCVDSAAAINSSMLNSCTCRHRSRHHGRDSRRHTARLELARVVQPHGPWQLAPYNQVLALCARLLCNLMVVWPMLHCSTCSKPAYKPRQTRCRAHLCCIACCCCALQLHCIQVDDLALQVTRVAVVGVPGSGCLRQEAVRTSCPVCSN